MIQIFSKEFKEAIREKLGEAVDSIKSVATPETKAKIVNMYDKAKDAIQENVISIKEAAQPALRRLTQEEMEARTASKKAARDAAKAAAKQKQEEISAHIKEISNREDVEEVYCQRSMVKPTYKIDEDEPVVTEVAKVTVIGVVKRLVNDRFRLQISLSRRNPSDQFIKNLGYLVALERAYDPRASFEIEGHNFETIKVGDFDSPLLKDMFLSIADELIDEYEYYEEHYTKAMRNSIKHNAEQLVDYVKTTCSKE